jgi:CheY-like chemotaxis protein
MDQKDTISRIETPLPIESTGSGGFMEALSVQVIGGIIAGIALILLVAFWKKIFGTKDNTDEKEIPLKVFSDLEFIYSSSELPKQLKILVVDDEDIFPVTGFKEFGYNIDKWDKIDATRLQSLQNGDFDLIVLDIVGVAQEIAVDDGFEIMQNLKNNNPAQIVIAYSGQTFDISKSDFWQLADEKLGKPTPFVETQEKLHQLIQKKFKIQNYLTLIESILQSTSNTNKLELVKENIVKSVDENGIVNWDRELNWLNNNPKAKQQIVAISKSLIKNVKFK